VPSIGEMPERSPQEISNGDEIGDVNERTHGMEFYGTSSNHVLLNQLFSFVRNNRRHGQLRTSTINPIVPSNDDTEVGGLSTDRYQGHQSSERPSAVNLLSIEEPLFPPSRRDTPPPSSQSRETQGAFNRENTNLGSQAASTTSLRLTSSNVDVSSHLRSPGRIGGDGIPLTAAKHRFERELVRSYLHNLHYLHPMLDGTEFVLQCEAEVWSLGANAKKSAQRRHFMALFNIVVAVGALVAGREVAEEFSQEIVAIEQSKHQTLVSPQQISLRTLSRSYFQEARASLGDVFEVCSLESAQTLLLMVSTTLHLGKCIRFPDLRVVSILPKHAQTSCLLYVLWNGCANSSCHRLTHCGYGKFTPRPKGCPKDLVVSLDCFSRPKSIILTGSQVYIFARDVSSNDDTCHYAADKICDSDMCCSSGRRDSVGKPHNYPISFPKIKVCRFAWHPDTGPIE
jgi:hypothetical protein